MITNTLVVKQNASEHLNKLFEGIFPRWTTIVATILAVLILMFFLTKMLYKPIKKMVKERQKFIQENIDNSIKQNNNALQDRDLANQELLSARVAASEIVSKAKLKAEKLREEHLAKAKDDANSIISNAKKEIEREKIIFTQESRKEMVEVALAAAKKIVEKEVNNKANQQLVKDFIENKYDK